jgi:energy-converting hydrogenase Eha subunit A
LKPGVPIVMNQRPVTASWEVIGLFSMPTQ